MIDDSQKQAPPPAGTPTDARRRAALARLGLAATAAYAAPVILRLSPAVALVSHCSGGGANCNGNGNGNGNGH
jgi:hypothetical protein